MIQKLKLKLVHLFVMTHVRPVLIWVVTTVTYLVGMLRSALSMMMPSCSYVV